MTAYLTVDSVTQAFPLDGGGTYVALKDIDLSIREGEFVSLIGHSGCGKSTLLNLLAGLNQASSGRILVNGRQVVEAICSRLDVEFPSAAPHAQLITRVADRPGHDRRYAIDPARITTELGWQPRHSFEAGLAATVDWYLAHRDWCERVRGRAGYGGGRLGTGAGDG